MSEGTLPSEPPEQPPLPNSRVSGKDTDSPLVPPSPPNPLRDIGRYLYNSNPFYAISASLILVGLHMLCNDPSLLADPNSLAAAGWLHLILLAGYTVLLAGAGVVVVRAAGIWEDARTILLSVLLLLVAMSVEFDHLLLTRPSTAKSVLCVGAVFALLLVEFTIRGARVQLPIGYRTPLFAALALFFLYPVLVLLVLDQIGFSNNNLGREGTKWLVFLFPAVAALIALMLLPAASKGPSYVARNGTPWRWPWYPWPVFVFLAVGVCFRAYYLTLSFDPQARLDSAFGFYYLTPFLIATAAVVFEAARSSRSVAAQSVALMAPLLLLLATLPGDLGSPAYRAMLRTHLDTIGPPVAVATWGLLILYGYAVLRGIRAARAGVGAMLAFAAFIGPRTIDFGSFVAKPSMWPFALLTAGAAALVVRDPRSSARWCLLAVSGVGLGLAASPGDSLHASQVGAAALLVCGLAMIIGTVFDDVFAELARQWGAMGLVVASFYVTFSESPQCVALQTNGSALIFAIVVTTILFAVARKFESEFLTGLGFFSLIPVGVRIVGHVAAILKLLRNPAAVALVVGGAASFLLGAAITAVKAGWRPFRKRIEDPSTPDS